MRRATAIGVVAIGLLAPTNASAATDCTEPGQGGWERATPAEAGMMLVPATNVDVAEVVERFRFKKQ